MELLDSKKILGIGDRISLGKYDYKFYGYFSLLLVILIGFLDLYL